MRNRVRGEVSGLPTERGEDQEEGRQQWAGRRGVQRGGSANVSTSPNDSMTNKEDSVTGEGNVLTNKEDNVFGQCNLFQGSVKRWFKRLKT